MTGVQRKIAMLLGVCAAAGCAPWSRPEGPPRIVRIRALPRALRLVVEGPLPAARIVELRPYQDYGPEAPSVWEGALRPGTIELARFHGQQDRLYSRFQLVDAATGQPTGPPRYADDLSGLPAQDFEMPWPESIKGITCPVDLDDLEALGVKYVATNVVLAGLLDWRSERPEATWEVDGEPIGINLDYVHGLDRQIKRMNDAGINVTLILLNSVPTQPEPDNPLIHPRTDLAAAPRHLGAFNCTDERGLRHFRAAVEFLAYRYSRPDRRFGRVSGYTIGNELQAHWVWHNRGEASIDELVRDYAVALRVAWLAGRRHHAQVRVYVSMDHHWTRLQSGPTRSCRGDELLERLNAETKATGDFPWHVAFHPYPENLGNPRFWQDRSAELSFQTPRITFRNIEVLPMFLKQERFLVGGQPRRIILSEQGFHCPDGPDGETVQAAAYACAWHKVRHIPQIDAFILHRHVDYRGEGIRVGLWTCKQDDPRPCVPERKRLLWDVFRLADTDQWEQAFEFAKPIIGIQSWDEALPAEKLPEWAEPPARDALIYDLVEHRHEAKLADTADWRRAHVQGDDGRLYPTLFQHPPVQEGRVGDATFTVPLPASQPGRHIVLRFGTVLTGESANGVGFAIVVNDERAWSAKQDTGKATWHSLDLSAHAGRTIQLTLRVDSLGDATYDWANWVQPVIVFEPKAASLREAKP